MANSILKQNIDQGQIKHLLKDIFKYFSILMILKTIQRHQSTEQFKKSATNLFETL